LAKHTTPPERLESVTVAAARVGVSEQTVRRWIRLGIIRGYRIGPRQVRVDLDEVTQAIQHLPTAG
jgi:excisionase family DNA binding protein